MTYHPKVLNNLDESHFLNEKSIADQFYFDANQKDILSQIYKKSQSYEYGLSQNGEDTYLRMFKVYKFLLKSKVDYIIHPIILIKDVNNCIQEMVDPQYKELCSTQCITEDHKIIPYITYSHVVPDGRIIEYIHALFVNTLSVTDIYNETMSIRQSLNLSTELNHELDINEDISKKRIKL